MVRVERESPPPSIHEHPRTKAFKDFLWAGWLAAARAESGRRKALVLEDGGGFGGCHGCGCSIVRLERGMEVMLVMVEGVKR